MSVEESASQPASVSPQERVAQSNTPQCPSCSAPTDAYAIYCTSCGAVVDMATLTYGGFWIRLAAFVVDVVPAALVLSVVTVDGAPLSEDVRGGLSIGFAWVCGIVMESSPLQATLGKMIFGMRVTDTHGRRLSFLRSTGRQMAKIVSLLTLCIGFLMIGADGRKQGLHDRFAQTLVVKRKR